jgi:3-phosphoshikimate 1-carboxyvinyltransferase
MRLLAGLLAAAPFEVVLDGDASLRTRPMERVAEPLRRMGAHVGTDEGHPPVVVRGATLRGIVHEAATPSAQVKGAVLLAGVAADGTTAVREPAPTRDHTERALAALGGPVEVDADRIEVSRFQHEGFSAVVPGDPSSAGFPIAAAVLTGGSLRVEAVGVNPTRLGYLEVLGRMGVRTRVEVRGEELGEPVGTIEVDAGGPLRGTTVAADELPRVIDEVPLLAAVAAHAEGETRFRGVGELRVKESDRVAALVAGLRGLGGDAVDEGDDLVVGGGGLAGGAAAAAHDHRIAMALVVAALAARGPSSIEGVESAEVSFPGFLEALGLLGARVEAER